MSKFIRKRSLAEFANETVFRSSKDKARRPSQRDIENGNDQLSHPLVSYERRYPWEVELGKLNVDETNRKEEAKSKKSSFKKGEDGGAIFIFE